MIDFRRGKVGYPADFIRKEEIVARGVEFISKPVSPEALMKKVRKVPDKR